MRPQVGLFLGVSHPWAHSERGFPVRPQVGLFLGVSLF